MLTNLKKLIDYQLRLPAKVTVNTTGNQQPAELTSQTNADKHETSIKSRSDTKQSTTSDFHTIIIGASLMSHVKAPEGYIVCNKPGAKIQDDPKLIKNEETELKGKLNPKNVALHLGTNNVSDSQTRSMDIMMTFTSTIAGILYYFPDITLGICSIPPRKGGGATQRESNKIARGLNAFFEVHCRQKQDQLVYIHVDTWFVLWNTAEQLNCSP